MSIRAETVTPALLRAWPLPEPGDSKHSRGHVVVVEGSRSTPGALALAGLGALRVGAGVLALAAPDAVAVPLAVEIPESSVHPYDELDCWRGEQLAATLGEADAVLVGPGIDDPQTALDLVAGLPVRVGASTAVALDAFALGVLHDAGSELMAQRRRIVLSPNREEAARLLDGLDELPDEAMVAAAIAERWQAVVTYQSTVAAPDGRLWRVETGHAGPGTSGSGDVLAGAVVGLLARGAEASQAAVWATYLHAAAGDRLAARVGRLGFLAREVLDQLPAVMTELQA